MDKTYNHKEVEEKIYKNWEEKGYFKPEINPNGQPYCIILPPPNANGALHFGHAMYSVEDVLIRYHRMKGYATLWLPGTDHAGIETQYVFEKSLQKEGKSRFDYKQEELYKLIWDFVASSQGKIQNQLRKLGFSLDWSREKYTLDSDIVKLVYQTFKRMYDEGLIYRGHRLVNYCTKDGTSFSDLEVKYVEQKDPLYYLKYGPFVLATVRPETKFGDTAVAVHPDDKRYQEWIGKEIEVEGLHGKFKLKVIADEAIDPNFGTGVAKVTPSIDMKDFEIGKRHNLPMKLIVDFNGRLTNIAGPYAGMKVMEARKKVAEDMEKRGLIEKIDENYVHSVAKCYKCGTTLEPLPLPQWYVRVDSLRKQAIEVVKQGKIRLIPKMFETRYFQWLENLKDWNISRQIVWGIRIPAWRCLQCHSERSEESHDALQKRLGSSRLPRQARDPQDDNNSGWIITEGEKPEKCPVCGSNNLKQDIDTFDTWFSSGQWPFATLMSCSNSKFKIQNSKFGDEKDVSLQKSDFERFYPTDVLETAYDILPAWVSRMVMMGLYATKQIPFKDVVFHGIVNDPYGKKMSKSKGNVVNPLELIDQYGADSVRFALIYGNATGNDQALSYSKLDAARKFANKVWNIARFITLCHSELDGLPSGTRLVSESPEKQILNHLQCKQVQDDIQALSNSALHETDKEWVEKVGVLSEEITEYLDKYQFNLAAERLYEFIWHEFADKYIEDVKNRLDENSFSILNSQFSILLKLLHPFMPFVTEEIYHQLGGEGESLMIATWPKV